MFLCNYIHVQYVNSETQFGELIRNMTGEYFDKIFLLSYGLVTNDGIEDYIGFETSNLDKFILRIMDISKSFTSIVFTINSIEENVCAVIQNGIVTCYTKWSDDVD